MTKKKKNIIDDYSIQLLNGKMQGNKRETEHGFISLIKKMNPDLINLKDRDGRTLLMSSCIYDYYDLAKELIVLNADVNSQDNLGFTPLHAAVKSGNIRLVELLLNSGASPNIVDRFGNNVAIDAVMNWEILRILIEHKCELHTKNLGGVSAYDLVRMHPDILTRLQIHFPEIVTDSNFPHVNPV